LGAGQRGDGHLRGGESTQHKNESDDTNLRHDYSYKSLGEWKKWNREESREAAQGGVIGDHDNIPAVAAKRNRADFPAEAVQSEADGLRVSESHPHGNQESSA